MKGWDEESAERVPSDWIMDAFIFLCILIGVSGQTIGVLWLLTP